MIRLRNASAPNLPLAPVDYGKDYQDQLNNVLRLYFNQIDNLLGAINGTGGASYLQSPNGAWYDTTTQTRVAINTPQAVTFNSVVVSNQIGQRTAGDSKIYVDKAGYYNFQFSAQIGKASGGNAYIWIWFRVNGVDIPDSSSKVAVQGASAESVPAWNFVLPMNADDYFELMWATDDGVEIMSIASTSFAPATPSVILTATFVSALYT
jgi:hypothetical protein